MSTLKFIYRDQIYKTSILPENYSSLVSTLKVLLKSHLPQSYFLQYQDSEGDRVMLAGEEDYKAMCLTELPKDNRTSVRVFVIPKEDSQPNMGQEEESNRTSKDLENEGNSRFAEIQSEKASDVREEDISYKPTPETRSEVQIESEDEKEEKEPEFYEEKGEEPSREDLKNQKKFFKKEFKMHRKQLKEDYLKGIMSQVLYDNLPNMAKIIGSYVSNPNVDLEEMVKKVRPPPPKIEKEQSESGPDFFCKVKKGMFLFKSLINHYKDLPEDRKKGVSCALGGIPDQLLSRMEEDDQDREKRREEWWERRAHHLHQFPPFPHHHHPYFGPRHHFAYGFESGMGPHREDFNQDMKHSQTKPYEKKWKGSEESSGKESWKSSKQNQREERGYNYEEKRRGKDKWRQEEPSGRDEIKYSVEFVKEVGSVPNIVMVGDDTIYKTITIRNNGKTTWPKGTLFVPRGEVRSQTVMLSNIKPGEEFSPVLMLKNPGKAGKYTSDWKLAYKDDQGKTIYTNSAIKVELVVYEEDFKEKIGRDNLRKKADKLKKIFPQVDIDYILDLLNQAPDLSLEELAENYLRS